MTYEQATKLAAKLIDECCIEGIRGTTGKYRHIDNDEKLLAKIAEFIYKDQQMSRCICGTIDCKIDHSESF